jgi:hypothetical protein
MVYEKVEGDGRGKSIPLYPPAGVKIESLK